MSVSMGFGCITVRYIWGRRVNISGIIIIEAVGDMMEAFDDGRNSIVVQWNRIIGKHIDEAGNEVPTTRGTINFAQDGTFHIVPRAP